MNHSNKPNDFLTVNDLDNGQLKQILDSSKTLQNQRNKWSNTFDFDLNKAPIFAFFAKESNRTSTAIELAIGWFNWIPIIRSWTSVLPWKDSKVREEPEEIAQVANEYWARLIFARVFDHKTLKLLAENSSVPIINALCDKHHPTQALADMLTMKNQISDWEKVKVAWVWDWNNVANSLAQICAKIWMDISIASPNWYELASPEQKLINKIAQETWASIQFLTNPEEALKGAKFVHSDTFVSMWDEWEYEKRMNDFKWFQINQEMMNLAKPDAQFMHCMPAHLWKEVTEDVFRWKQSLVIKQAWARLDTIRALIQFFG